MPNKYSPEAAWPCILSSHVHVGLIAEHRSLVCVCIHPFSIWAGADMITMAIGVTYCSLLPLPQPPGAPSVFIWLHSANVHTLIDHAVKTIVSTSSVSISLFTRCQTGSGAHGWEEWSGGGGGSPWLVGGHWMGWTPWGLCGRTHPLPGSTGSCLLLQSS